MAPLAPRAGGRTHRFQPPSRPAARLLKPTLISVAVLTAFALAGCSSSTSGSRLSIPSSSTTDPTAPIKAAILKAWSAAETAFYQAEANPQGLDSPALAQTMANPELELVETNLAGQEAEGFIGHGTWNLGTPRVVSLGPTESDPVTATVVSCIDDTAILINEQTGQPATGPNGTPEWAGETSTMVLSQGSWKATTVVSSVTAIETESGKDPTLLRPWPLLQLRHQPWLPLAGVVVAV